MLNRRIPLLGLLAVLLALMAQLGVGAAVPWTDPIAALPGFSSICHATDDAGPSPGRPVDHPADCLVCPLCIAAHAPSVALVSPGPILAPSRVLVVARVELPPPATAPPAPHRPPSQSRAPPIYS